jgi:hypothetical protein
MSDFMQRQFEISNQLIRAMYRDAEERANFEQSFHALIAEKDRTIAKLEATIEAMKVLKG